MNTLIIILAAATMLLLALFMSYILGWANRTFHVTVDPRQEAVLKALPGANCGGCGFVGCSEYAEAVTAGKAPVDLCPVGGAPCAEAVARILGVDHSESTPRRPIVHCRATTADKLKRTEYRGEPSCAAANLIAAIQGCTYGCLGLGDCVEACNYDAIHIIDGLATIDYDKCIGCGACVKACPRNIISMAPFTAKRMLAVACNNKDFGKDVKAVCKVGCTGCKLCVKFGGDTFTVADNLSIINYDVYVPTTESLDAAAAKCPSKCLIYVGKKTAESDVPIPEAETSTS